MISLVRGTVLDPILVLDLDLHSLQVHDHDHDYGLVLRNELYANRSFLQRIDVDADVVG